MFHKALIVGALASAVVGETTLSVFLPGGPSDEKFVGSLVGVNDCKTTLALVCTAGGIETLGTSLACEPTQTETITFGSDFYEASTRTALDGATATAIASCSLAGTTSAVCSEYASLAEDGQHTASSTTLTLTGSDLVYRQVPITAGATGELGSGTCTGGAAGTSTGTATSGNAAAATGLVGVYKVLVVPAAALVAGALI